MTRHNLRETHHETHHHRTIHGVTKRKWVKVFKAEEVSDDWNKGQFHDFLGENGSMEEDGTKLGRFLNHGFHIHGIA
jgi:hypothetical protein